MGIPAYLNQDIESSSTTRTTSLRVPGTETTRPAIPPTLPPRHPHRRLTHHYQQHRRDAQQIDEDNQIIPETQSLLRHFSRLSPLPSALTSTATATTTDPQTPTRPPRQNNRVDTITPRRGSERSSILFRFYQQQQQVHHLRQIQGSVH
ncbi:hypothetical protein BGZ94_009778 [Podila epigama]|nr:hypothetical protein BGZ94_009778 [Podila epigama]